MEEPLEEWMVEGSMVEQMVGEPMEEWMMKGFMEESRATKETARKVTHGESDVGN